MRDPADELPDAFEPARPVQLEFELADLSPRLLDRRGVLDVCRQIALTRWRLDGGSGQPDEDDIAVFAD